MKRKKKTPASILGTLSWTVKTPEERLEKLQKMREGTKRYWEKKRAEKTCDKTL